MMPDAPHLQRTMRSMRSYSNPSDPIGLIPPMAKIPSETPLPGSCIIQISGAVGTSMAPSGDVSPILPEGHPTDPATISSRMAGSSDCGRSFHGVPAARWQNPDMEHMRSSSRTRPGPSYLSHLSENGLRSAFSRPLNLLWDDPSQKGDSLEYPHLQRAYVSPWGFSRTAFHP